RPHEPWSDPQAAESFARGLTWLGAAQHANGSWGGDGTTGTIEETALALEALASVTANHGEDEQKFRSTIERGTRFLIEAVETGAWREPSPIGFYFAKLWYYERLYPMIFTVAALGAFKRFQKPSHAVSNDRAFP